VQRESYVHGNSGPPLIGKTIGALLDDVLPPPALFSDCRA
jgi:hypothetical protein